MHRRCFAKDSDERWQLYNAIMLPQLMGSYRQQMELAPIIRATVQKFGETTQILIMPHTE